MWGEGYLSGGGVTVWALIKGEALPEQMERPMPRLTSDHILRDAVWPHKHLTAAGFSPGALVGKGFDGMVFEHSPGKVVKATTCSGEVWFFDWLMRTDRHPGFPEPFDIAEIGRWKGKKLYAVVREDVQDLLPRDFHRIYGLAEDLWPQVWTGQRTRQGWDEGCARVLARTADADRHLIFSLIDALTWALERGCDFVRVHDGNLGIRGAQLVFRDLSRCFPPADWRFSPRKTKRPSR